MKLKSVYAILLFSFLPFYLVSCAQVATGTAMKVVTVTKEERSIGEFVDDTLIKAVIKTIILIRTKIYFLILM